MGVVYLAQQKKLHRRVALKMLLGGAHAGSEQMARFFIEAEAVAHLRHPAIVQIYEVGEHEGLPFFSLEYVDGGCLADRIAGKPQPVREAAGRVEVLALAMAYAHQNGIIHRDLKPANILLTADGLPKITDFGLAKRLESDASQTKSGTLMGTPNYMAPEQARGDTHGIGPLADIYALGVILYEMLTGRTPFLGASILDTLHQVQSQEPVPPSTLQPTVPRDLETICLKCLQKEPAKRYATAAALAEDLNRFLSGQPILARPVGRVERVWRWCRRNPKVAALTFSVLALLVFAAVGSSAAAWKISQEKAEVERQRGVAEEQREIAVAASELAEQRRKDEAAARLLADQNAKVANEQAGLALTTIQILIDKVQKQLEEVPGNQQLKKDLLKTALDGLKQVAQKAATAATTERTMAAAHKRMGDIFRQLGDTDEAFRQYLRCHEIVQANALAEPNNDKAKSNLAATFTIMGDMSQELRRDIAASADYYQKALTLREELYAHPQSADLSPADRISRITALAETSTRVGVTFFRLGDPAAALVHFKRSLESIQSLTTTYPQDVGIQLELARCFSAVGEASFRVKDAAAGKTYYDQCSRLRESLYKTYPKNFRIKQELARWYGVLGELDRRSGNSKGAGDYWHQYLKLGQELAAIDPNNVDFQNDVANAYYRLGMLAQQQGDRPGAQKAFSECRKIRESLAAADRVNDRKQIAVMLVLPHCDEYQQAEALAEKFAAAAAKDRELLIEIACCYAQCAAAVPNNPKLAQRYRDKALAAIANVIAQGYKDSQQLETDPDLDPLRDQPRFKALLAKLGQS